VGDNLWVNVESRSHSFPEPPGTVEIRWCFPRFRPWTGEPISYTYGGKAVLDLAGEPLFAELVILRLLEREGWQGVWVDTYHGKFRIGLPRVVEPVGLPAEQARRFAVISSVLDPERFTSRPDRVPRGTWDVFAWRGDEVLFVESKRGKRDRMHDHQWVWLAAALRAGLPPEAFLIVERDLAQPG
jgi:hypothetical protein